MLQLKRTMAVCVTAGLIWSFSGQASQAEIQVDFTRVYAPNSYGSANYTALWDNAQHAVTNGLCSYGSGLAEFKDITEVTGIQSYVTNFQSWNGAEVAGEYGGRASWVYHIYDTEGAALTFDNITKEYFDDYGEPRHSTSGWGPIAIDKYDATKFVGIKSDGTITTNSADEVVGLIGMSGNSWWFGRNEAEDGDGYPAYDADGDGDLDDPDYIKTSASPYWNDRFDLLAADGADAEQNQTLWGFAIGYGGQTFTAPDIKVVPEPATMSLLAVGCISLCGIFLMRRKQR